MFPCCWHRNAIVRRLCKRGDLIRGGNGLTNGATANLGGIADVPSRGSILTPLVNYYGTYGSGRRHTVCVSIFVVSHTICTICCRWRAALNTIVDADRGSVIHEIAGEPA